MERMGQINKKVNKTVEEQNVEQFTLSGKETHDWRKAFKMANEKVFQDLTDYLGVRESQGMGKQVNRGKLAEMWLQKTLGLYPNFDKVNDWDFVYNYQKIQFKYLGQNSSPSVSELIRLEDESMVKFVNRIMKHYQNCEVFVLSFDNFIQNMTWKGCIKLSAKDFKGILRAHDKNVKIGNKLRLRKTVVKNYINDNL